MSPLEADVMPAGRDLAWAAEIEQACGEPVSLCYGCGVCSGSCPLSAHMDLLPSRLVKAVQLGLRTRATSAVSPWLCLACEACAVRCPNGIDVPKVMDAVRQAGSRRHPAPLPDVEAFHQWFLRTVRVFGRAHEGLLSAGYSVQRGHLRRDLPTGLALFMRGRLALWPHLVRRRGAIRRIFGGSTGR